MILRDLEQFYVLRAIAALGFLNLEAFERSIDDTIASTEVPDDIILELSLSSKSVEKTTSTLDEYIRKNRSNIRQNHILGYLEGLKNHGHIGLMQLVMIMYSLTGFFDERMSDWISHLDTEYHLVSNRYVNQSIHELEANIDLTLKKKNLPTLYFEWASCIRNAS